MAAELNEQELETALSAFLAGELDTQRGRALACFRQRLVLDADRPRWSRRALLIWGAVGLAASLAWVAAGLAFQPRKPVSPAWADADLRPTAMPVIQLGQPVEQVLAWRSEDGGTVLLPDGTPARQVVRREYQRTRWVDPVRNVSVERTSPSDQIFLIPLQTY